MVGECLDGGDGHGVRQGEDGGEVRPPLQQPLHAGIGLRHFKTAAGLGKQNRFKGNSVIRKGCQISFVPQLADGMVSAAGKGSSQSAACEGQ